MALCPSAVCGLTPFDHKMRRRVCKRAACGFPGNQLTWNPIFPEINIKISCSYNGVRITISGVVWTRMASIGIPGCLGMFQFNCRDLSRFCFGVQMKTIKTHVD